jgi:hypothetical protein
MTNGKVLVQRTMSLDGFPSWNSDRGGGVHEGDPFRKDAHMFSPSIPRLALAWSVRRPGSTTPAAWSRPR